MVLELRKPRSEPKPDISELSLTEQTPFPRRGDITWTFGKPLKFRSWPQLVTHIGSFLATGTHPESQAHGGLPVPSSAAVGDCLAHLLPSVPTMDHLSPGFLQRSFLMGLFLATVASLRIMTPLHCPSPSHYPQDKTTFSPLLRMYRIQPY